MKVKDLIAKLQTLDQDKDIHLIYDSCYEIPFVINLADEDDTAKEGDYIIYAG